MVAVKAGGGGGDWIIARSKDSGAMRYAMAISRMHRAYRHTVACGGGALAGGWIATLRLITGSYSVLRRDAALPGMDF